MIPTQAFFLDRAPASLDILKMNNYQDIIAPDAGSVNFLGMNGHQVYVLSVVLGSLSVLLSSSCFDTFLEFLTFDAFSRSARMCRLLLATTSIVDSCRERVPYAPLFRKDNLQAFLKLNSFLRVHEQGTRLGEAATGFAGLLLITIVILALTVYMFFTSNISMWRTLALFIYYDVISTIWCFRILAQAVLINYNHDRTILRLVEYQTNSFVTTDDRSKEESDEMWQLLEHVKLSIKQNFRPVTILGIPATVTLVKVFATYLASAVGAILSKTV
jgi:uncharacterized protein (DUF983 family)